MAEAHKWFREFSLWALIKKFIKFLASFSKEFQTIIEFPRFFQINSIAHYEKYFFRLLRMQR